MLFRSHGNLIEEAGVKERLAEPVEPAGLGEETGLSKDCFKKGVGHDAKLPLHDVRLTPGAHDAAEIAMMGRLDGKNSRVIA